MCSTNKANSNSDGFRSTLEDDSLLNSSSHSIDSASTSSSAERLIRDAERTLGVRHAREESRRLRDVLIHPQPLGIRGSSLSEHSLDLESEQGSLCDSEVSLDFMISQLLEEGRKKTDSSHLATSSASYELGSNPLSERHSLDSSSVLLNDLEESLKAARFLPYAIGSIPNAVRDDLVYIPVDQSRSYLNGSSTISSSPSDSFGSIGKEDSECPSSSLPSATPLLVPRSNILGRNTVDETEDSKVSSEFDSGSISSNSSETRRNILSHRLRGSQFQIATILDRPHDSSSSSPLSSESSPPLSSAATLTEEDYIRENHLSSNLLYRAPYRSDIDDDDDDDDDVDDDDDEPHGPESIANDSDLFIPSKGDEIALVRRELVDSLHSEMESLPR